MSAQVEARNQLAKNLAAADTSMSADYMPYGRAVDVLLSDVSLLMTALGAEESWICGVADSGFHNGAVCDPSAPHGGYWGCGYGLRLTVQEVQQ